MKVGDHIQSKEIIKSNNNQFDLKQPVLKVVDIRMNGDYECEEIGIDYKSIRMVDKDWYSDYHKID